MCRHLASTRGQGALSDDSRQQPGPQGSGRGNEAGASTVHIDTVTTATSGIWPVRQLPRGDVWCTVNAQYRGVDVWLVLGAVHVLSHLLLHRGSFCQNWVLRHGQLFIRCWGTVSGGGVSFEEEGTVYVKTERPETTQGCHGITVTLEECEEVCGAGGKGTWGSRRLG